MASAKIREEMPSPKKGRIQEAIEKVMESSDALGIITK